MKKKIMKKAKEKEMNIELTNVTPSKEIAMIPRSEIVSFNAETLIMKAIEINLPIETMKELLAMRTQLKNEWSKEQFEIAMGKLQGECPVIKKTKAGGTTNSGQVAYYYAPLDSIIIQTKEIIKENGFSYDFISETLENKVKVTCNVNHISGYSKAHMIEMPLGAKTNIMSAPQVVASALTFSKRYSFCDAFGIATGDDDNDANYQMPREKINEEHKELIASINKVSEIVWLKLNEVQKKDISEIVSGKKVVEKSKLETILSQLNAMEES